MLGLTHFGSLGFRVVVKNIHEVTRIYTKKAKKISEIGDIMPECVNLWLKLKL